VFFARISGPALRLKLSCEPGKILKVKSDGQIDIHRKPLDFDEAAQCRGPDDYQWSRKSLGGGLEAGEIVKL
jgi:hypothetical protein